jgi:hypothetical protein
MPLWPMEGPSNFISFSTRKNKSRAPHNCEEIGEELVPHMAFSSLTSLFSSKLFAILDYLFIHICTSTSWDTIRCLVLIV